MKKSIFIVILAILAILAGAILSPSHARVAASSAAQLPEYCMVGGGNAAANSSYPDTEIREISAAEAEQAGAKGAEGNVIVLSGADGAGCEFDYSSYNISAYGIEQIVVRAYLPDDVRAISIAIDGGETNIGRYSVAGFERGKFTEFAFGPEGINIATDQSLSDLGIENGRLGKFSINFRRVITSYTGEEPVSDNAPVYLDSIQIILVDGAAGKPELHYNGPDKLDQTADKPFMLGEYSAYDAFEKRDLEVTARWEGTPGVDENGIAVEGGPYTLVLEAENSFGERAEKRLTLTVRPRDTEPPQLLVNTDTLYAPAGTYATMNVAATDNEDDVETLYLWSKNALDRYGRLQAGEHKLTLTATDLTGNTTERVLTVIVSEAGALPEGAADGSVPVPNAPAITRDESKLQFGLPGWAVPLIVTAGIIMIGGLAAAVLSLIARPKRETEATH
ncbi:MAG: hypothetical protein J5584_02900 [Clostridia bacterium]|nr:hypothetical protein [Clostridia bacterium]